MLSKTIDRTVTRLDIQDVVNHWEKDYHDAFSNCLPFTDNQFVAIGGAANSTIYECFGGNKIESPDFVRGALYMFAENNTCVMTRALSDILTRFINF